MSDESDAKSAPLAEQIERGAEQHGNSARDDQQAVAAATRELLMARVGDRRYGFSVEGILSVLRPTNLTPVPHVPAYVSGVFNHQGRVMPLIDFAALIGAESDRSSARWVVLGEGELEAAIAVDEVNGIETVELETIEPPPGGSEADRPFVEGQTPTHLGLVVIINVSKLLHHTQASEGRNHQ